MHLFSLCLDRGNFLSTITDDYIKKCNFDKVDNTYCPIFRVGDVVRYAQQNFSKLADKVSLSSHIWSIFLESALSAQSRSQHQAPRGLPLPSCKDAIRISAPEHHWTTSTHAQAETCCFKNDVLAFLCHTDSLKNLSQFSQGGVIGIKIGWVCDLDKSDDQCNPSYSFTRLDAMSQRTVVSPGYNFRSVWLG